MSHGSSKQKLPSIPESSAVDSSSPAASESSIASSGSKPSSRGTRVVTAPFSRLQHDFGNSKSQDSDLRREAPGVFARMALEPSSVPTLPAKVRAAIERMGAK